MNNDFSKKPISSDENGKSDDKKKKFRKRIIIILSAVAVCIIALVAYCLCVINGVGGKNIVNTKTDMMTTFSKKQMDIKYENPLMVLADKLVLGKNDTTVLRVNGREVSRDCFKYYFNNYACEYIYNKAQKEDASDPSVLKVMVENFVWEEKEDKTGLPVIEYIKAKTIKEEIIPFFTFISEGEKRGIALTDKEHKQIDDMLFQIKQQYGDNSQLYLKRMGFESEQSFREVMKVQLLYQLVLDDFKANMEKYVSPDKLEKYKNSDQVVAKHICIIKNPETEDPAVTKARAEEALQRLKIGGEDFDKISELYNMAQGQPADGYYHENDGSVVSNAVLALEVGEISDIIETEHEYYISKRMEQKVGDREYINMLSDNINIRIKRGAYNSIIISEDELKTMFGIIYSE